MEKVLVEIFVTYGKGDGEELRDSYVVEDSRETREEVLEDWASNSLYIDGNVESFKEGSEDSLFVCRDGGDWDEPAGAEIVITSYDQKREEIESKYKADLAKLNRQFKVEAK